MSHTSWALEDRVAEYMVTTSLRDDSLLRRLREETKAMPDGRMQISPEQGQFMALLIRLLDAKRTVEVGTFTGYSALCVARALPADGRLVACDVSEDYTAVARRYWAEAGVADKIDLRLGPGVTSLQRLLDEGGEGTYDFAFIDADKASYDDYYELCLRLVRKGGLLAIDNVLWSGRVADESVQDDDTRAIRALNAKILGDQRVDQSLLPVGDGLTLARKR